MADLTRGLPLALAFVLFASAAGSGDYVLRLPAEDICAKSYRTCEAAREAIVRGWLPWAPPDAVTLCEPAPGCFPPESNVIKGYNDRDR